MTVLLGDKWQRCDPIRIAASEDAAGPPRGDDGGGLSCADERGSRQETSNAWGATSERTPLCGGGRSHGVGGEDHG